VIQEAITLKYEPASEPLHISEENYLKQVPEQKIHVARERREAREAQVLLLYYSQA